LSPGGEVFAASDSTPIRLKYYHAGVQQDGEYKMEHACVKTRTKRITWAALEIPN